MEKPILIWGAGAIGGTVGAYLAHAGHPVVFVDKEPAHVQAINEKGLAISGKIGNFVAHGQAFTPETLPGAYDLVILAVKAQDTQAAAQAIAPHLSDDGAIVSLQNGLNEPLIAQVVGIRRVVGAFINFGADWLAPGEILYAGRGPVVVGEVNGEITERAKSIHGLLQRFEPDAVLTDNVYGYLWGKLAFSGILIASALTNEKMADFFGSMQVRPLVIAVVREILGVAAANGIVPIGFQGFDPDAFWRNDTQAIGRSMDALVESRRHSTKLHTGFWRDLAVRKRKSEVRPQFEPIQAAARAQGLKTPIVDRLLEMIEEIEGGRRELGLHSALELQDLAVSAQAAY